MNKAEQVILVGMIEMRIPTKQELALRIGLKPGTLNKNIRDPGSMSIGRLRAISEQLAFTDEQIAQIVRNAPKR